jgi:hypothetical protein
MQPRRAWIQGCAAAAAALVALAAYVAALCPSPYWHDSSQFAAAAVLLGVPQPPGHPIAMLLYKAVALLPFGPGALRVGLSQALCSAAAAAFLALAGAQLSARVRAALDAEQRGGPGALDAAIGAGVAVVVSLGHAVAFQSVRPEVYALQGLLYAASAFLLLRYDETEDLRFFAIAALVMGLGLANHHYIMGTCILPAALLLRAPAGRALRLCLPLGALGLILYLYLPLRAAHHPLINWGAATSLSRMIWVISAAPFQKSVTHPLEATDLEAVIALVEALGPLLTLIAMMGLYLLFRQRDTRRAGAYLLGTAALCTIGRVLQKFDVANPDCYGYLIPAIYALCLVTCAGLASLCVVTGRFAPALAALPLLLAGARGATEPARFNRSGFYDQDVLVGSWLREAPPRALALTGVYQTVFSLWYLQGVEGLRPDVRHVHRHFFDHPGYRDEQLARAQDGAESDATLAQVLGEKGPILDLLRRERRPVLWEYDTMEPPGVAPHLAPRGLFAEVVRDGSPPAPSARDQAQAARERAAAQAGQADVETRRVQIWRAFANAHLACAQRDTLTLRAEVARLKRALAGAQDPDAEALLLRCVDVLAGGR